MILLLHTTYPFRKIYLWSKSGREFRSFEGREREREYAVACRRGEESRSVRCRGRGMG
jgi:hypothetical protein